MTESERPYDPPPEAEAPPEEGATDGPLTPEEVENDPSVNPDDEELRRLKGG